LAGVEQREFAVDDPQAAARAVFDATGRFHNPLHASGWSDPGIDAAFEDVWALIVRGLAAPARSPGSRGASGSAPAQNAGKRAEARSPVER
jgi:hypothetical protein